MIAIQGNFYRISPSVKMNLIAPNETTPYAMVTFFHPEQHSNLQKIKSFKKYLS